MAKNEKKALESAEVAELRQVSDEYEIIDYQFVYATQSAIAQSVKNYLIRGYQPWGSPMINRSDFVLQAMVMYDKKQ